MGAGCCRCYQASTADEAKVGVSIKASSNNEDTKDAPQPINAVNSISASTSPVPSTGINVRYKNNQNGLTSTTISSTLETYDENNTDIIPNDFDEQDKETRQRLIEFYKMHNEKALNDQERINVIVRRYKGRESQLFNDLNKKYSVNTNTSSNASNAKQDDMELPETNLNETKSEEQDEHSPLNGKKQSKPKIKLPADSGYMTNNKRINKKAASPQSSSKRKPSKHLLGSESPPDSDYEAEDNHHPFINDEVSESTPIVAKKDNLMINIENKKVDKDKSKNSKSNKKEKLSALGSSFPSLKNGDSFKIQVTKPMKKKKPLGTDLFGTPTGSNRKKIDTDFGAKPLFKANSSNSVSRSTSFISGNPYDTPHSMGGPALPSLNIARSHTLTLDSTHKDKLDKRRQSSLAVRRTQDRRNLPIRINKVWAVFAQYLIDKIMKEKEEEKKEQHECQLIDQKGDDTKKKKKSKKTEDGLDGIDEDIEATPEPNDFNGNDILDSIINGKDDKNKKDTTDKSTEPGLHKKGHESIEVLSIDPRLFKDAKEKSRRSASSGRDSASSDNSSSSGDDDSDNGLDIDVYELELSYAQFNIVLNNNKVAVSPDMSAALVWLLLDINKLLDEEVKNLGLESDNLHNNPMKERGFHSKQFKKIYKCKITYKMIDKLMKHLYNGSVTRQDKSLNPKHLSYEKRNLVIWDKIFEHLINQTSFNVEEEYLYGALQDDVLHDGEVIVSMLSSLESHWQHRVQLMEHIDDKLNDGSAMERDIFFASILSENENYIRILNGWAIQLTDDRSGVARTAVTLLPAVLSAIILCITYPGILFDEQEVIHPIYDGIFTLVKNRRLKDMADDAYDTLIQVTDVFAEVATHLEDYSLMSIVIKLLENHTNPKIEKHDKCRESCIGGMGFLLYGVEPPPNTDLAVANGHNMHSSKSSGLLENPLDENNATTPSVPSTPLGALSDGGNATNDEDEDDDDDDGKVPDYIKGLSLALGLNKASFAAKTSTKLSKVMQRKSLLENEEFVTSFGNILKNGVSDKSESGRKKAFKLLQRLESEEEGKLLEGLQSKWDFTVIKKYNNWKKMEARKKDKGRKSGKKGKKRVSKRGKKKPSTKTQKGQKRFTQTKKDKDKDKVKDIKEENKIDNTTSTNTQIVITSDDVDKKANADAFAD